MSEQLPWEDEFSVDQWLAFEPRVPHVLWEDGGCYWAKIACNGAYDSFGATRNEAIVGSVKHWCWKREAPLPFRPRPDLSTVEGCMEAFASKATMIVFRGPTALAAGKCPLHVNIQKTANGPSRDFGKPGQPATLADLQDCAKFVLGIDTE